MSDTDILRELFSSRVVVRIAGSKVTLEEPAQPESRVTINNVPEDAVCIKADCIDMRQLFGDTDRGECKRADYLLFSESKKCVLVIELKSKKDAWPKICQQLHGASCLARYCGEVGKTFWRARDFLQGYRHCFVSISHTVIKRASQDEKVESSRLDPLVKIKRISRPHHLQYPKLIAESK